jgi:surface protein
MWALVNTVNSAIIDIVTTDDKYISIYEDLPLTIWIEWSAAPSDFNKKNIAKWCYDSKTSSFIKKIAIVPDIDDSLEMNKNTAKILLAKTDWAVLKDVNLYNRDEYINYRSTVRNCIINPREGPIEWPALIEPMWFDRSSMIINVYISSLSEYSTVTLPFNSISSLNVNWGNGFSTSYTTPTTPTTPTTYPTHTYIKISSYTITISGSALSYGDPDMEHSPIQSAISSVSQWGNIGLTSLANAFNKAINLVSLPTYIPSSVTDMSYMFYYATSFNQPLNTWNTSSVTNMSGMFCIATSFNQPLNTWNTSSVTNMAGMFCNATSFNQPLNTWNTSSVTNMISMFSYASSFNQDISDWNVSNVTVADNIFCDCPLSTLVNDFKRPKINIQGGYISSCG